MTLFKKSLAIVICTLTATSAFSHDDQQYSEQVVKSFSVNENTQLQIENTNGKVEIEAWDNDEIVVTATIYAHDKAGREKVTVAILQKGDTIDIDTHYKKQTVWNNHNSAKVDYFINVPEHIELDEVDLMNGSLAIKGVTGEVNATLKNGSIAATGLASNTYIQSKNGSVKLAYANDLKNLAHIDVESKNGSITVLFPDTINAKIEADSNNGSIKNGFGLTMDKRRSHHKSLSGIIGSGKAKVNLSSKNGSIRINRL